jgi:hypothetical protein
MPAPDASTVLDGRDTLPLVLLGNDVVVRVKVERALHLPVEIEQAAAKPLSECRGLNELAGKSWRYGKDSMRSVEMRY